VSQARHLQRATGVTPCKHLRDLSHPAEVLLLPLLPGGFQGGFVTASRTQHVRHPSERKGRQLTRDNRAFRRIFTIAIKSLNRGPSRNQIEDGNTKTALYGASSDHVLYNQIEDE